MKEMERVIWQIIVRVAERMLADGLFRRPIEADKLAVWFDAKRGVWASNAAIVLQRATVAEGG